MRNLALTAAALLSDCAVPSPFTKLLQKCDESISW